MTRVAIVGSASTLFSAIAWSQAASGGLTPSLDAATRSLSIAKRVIEVNGKAADVFGLLQPNGTTGLTLQAGEQFDVALSNKGQRKEIEQMDGIRARLNPSG
ncbi:hypothetical protein [Sinorhizobium sp. GL28]|uniref:hypothetical protein n=1 Tax=Sinorhizobium sp. GL28 TaxID=1358418 RepID=UPI00071C875E|nr:hypothetical protein [Sinorhizobium sp. GL28]KSV94684.1 hypothetical protein N184_36295 [Sinorhizobium sp. GL28]